MRRTLILIAVGVCAAVGIVATIDALRQRELPSYSGRTVTGTLRSTVLGEERELLVHLPASYEREPSRRYPVLYVLDGASHSAHTAEAARLLALEDAMPEVLVVGIPSSGENRNRDYTPPFIRTDDGGSPTGRADRFLLFLERELLPHVDRTWRATDERMLAGNSRGGLFVVYSLLERPALFRARLAFSPALWRDDDRIVRELESRLRARGGHDTFLYLSIGDGENEKMTRAFRKAVKALRSSPSATVRWHAAVTKDAVHGDNAVLSTPAGLRSLYRPTTPR